MPKVAKPKSKRVPVRLRHKIEKASAAKQRKQRKGAKKNPQWRSRLKKDPGIPNLFPYKAKVLAEIEEGKRRKEEEQLRRRELAKAQRGGRVVAEMGAMRPAVDAEEEVDDDEELENELLQVEEDDDEEMVENSANPMAALLASAQARAQAHEIELEDDDEGVTEWDGIDADGTQPALGLPTRIALPKQALADPVKAVSALMERMQKTQDGVQRLLDHYQIPPLVTAGSDLTSRFLVDVARKRGRLGRGGIPNLHSAALIVLGDLSEKRLQLPAEEANKSAALPAAAKGEVKVVSELAPAFRIEGLFGDDGELIFAEPMVLEA